MPTNVRKDKIEDNHSKKNRMEISIKFTQEELKLLSHALVFGIIHSDKDSVVEKMKELERKVNAIGALNGMEVK